MSYEREDTTVSSGEAQPANQAVEREPYTPEETVRLFYEGVSEGRYAEVYEEVFSKYRKSKITKEGFIGGFRNTISVTPLEVRTTQQDDSTARVAVKVKSLDRSETGGPEIEKVFQGEWVLVKSDGLWLLDRSNIRQVSVSGGGKASKQALVFSDGSKYEGEVVNGKPHGRGIQTKPDGGRYVGDWVDGKKHGKGVMTWPEGARYEGDFVDGNFHGKGTYTWPEGYYKGDWVEGHMTGKGIYDYEGEHYEGDFDHDRLSGKGIMTWADGTSYEGDWEGGQRTGYGVLKDKNGKVLKKGRFENDEYVGP
ncbi:MAG: MORN repeat protein [Candidatus Aminicenantes bacterium ADurb.Bin508]|nr:MAG: MORN repeat protein [Candidatus Aminicenantes bacterium ADurb.Bin508]